MSGNATEEQTKAICAKVVEQIGGKLGESPEAWRGANVVFEAVVSLLSHAMDNAQKTPGLNDAEKYQQGAVTGLGVITYVGLAWEEHPMAQASWGPS